MRRNPISKKKHKMLMRVSEVCILAVYDLPVSFETLIVYQFLMQLPTDSLSVIIQAKYVISKPKLS